MDVVKAINKVDSYELTVFEKTKVLAACRGLILEIEVSNHLKHALDAKKPDFKHFSRTALSRLEILLNAIPNNEQERIKYLGDEEPILIIVLGLCLTLTTIKRAKDHVWDGLVRQSKEIATEIRSSILANNEIAETIKSSTNKEFQHSFYRELQVRLMTSYTFSINGDEWYHYLISNAFRFHKLFDLALNRVVSVYVPKNMTSDCCIRFATPFNEDLLKTLFEFSISSYSVEEIPVVGSKNQVMPVLGEDVFQAMGACQTWRNESLTSGTTCVKGMVYPGHVIIMEILLERNAGIAFVNSS